MSNEVRQTIGFFLIEDGPIQLDYDNLALAQNNYGADPLTGHKIISRRSESLGLASQEDYTKELLNQIKTLMFLVVRWIEQNRVPGELVLHYQTIQLDWDVRVECAVYKRYG